MEKIFKRTAIIFAVLLAITAAILLIVFKPWTAAKSGEETVLINLEAVRCPDGRVYVYGREVGSVTDGEIADSPYGQLHSVTDGFSVPQSYICLAIVDADGAVDIKTDNFASVNGILSDEEWWAENIRNGTLPKSITVKLCV